MPIPEPGIYRPSNLTKKQQQDELASCYGVSMSEQISAADAEQLRQILQRYDLEHKPVQIINLNDPPKVSYKFQKFPMVVYDHRASQPAHEELRSAIVGSSVIEEMVHIRAKIVSRIVNSEAELQQALEDGLELNAPEFREDAEAELSAPLQMEAHAVEQKLAAARRAGRPTNAERAARAAHQQA
jgi:hypothetical protein